MTDWKRRAEEANEEHFAAIVKLIEVVKREERERMLLAAYDLHRAGLLTLHNLKARVEQGQ